MYLTIHTCHHEFSRHYAQICMYIKNINTDETFIIFLILSTILISINISSLDKTILAFKEIMCQVLITKNVSQNHVLGIKLYPKWFHLEWAIREHNYAYNYMYMLARTVLPAIPSITLKILNNFYILELNCVDNVENTCMRTMSSRQARW